MNTDLDDLLTRLEEMNARAVEISDPALHQAVDTVEVLSLIQQRGQLIEQLPPLLAAQAPVSYQEWNRLVVIHHQGVRIQDNLGQVRSRIAVALGANSSGRVFLERVTGMLAPVRQRT